MADSAIEWTEKVWNPVSGCTRVSAGCDNCYAVVMTRRLAAMGQAEKYGGLVNPGKSHFNGTIKLHPDSLGLPLKWKKPQRVFVNSMSDLFHKDVPFDFIDRVFAVMAQCPQHTFQVLTKRPERMAEWANRAYLPGAINDAHILAGGYGPVVQQWPLPNVWMGTSVENQEAAGERIPHLLRVPAAVRFLSCEPLLGPVDLRCVGRDGRGDDYDALFGWRTSYGSKARTPDECSISVSSVSHQRVHWVIVGGESGPGARRFNAQWARDIVSQCRNAGVAVFVKQMGSRPYLCSGAHDCPPACNCGDIHDCRGESGYCDLPVTKKGGNMGEWPEDLRVRQMPVQQYITAQ